MNPDLLGKCPTCDHEISLNATQCSNCGEIAFRKWFYTKRTCPRCNGSGLSFPKPNERKCIYCDGTGKEIVMIDLRNGGTVAGPKFIGWDKPTNWDNPLP
jgi:DnaJ-class molecular chaperone